MNGDKITSQTGFYRKLWSLGAAGVDVPLTVYHEGVTFDVVVTLDRSRQAVEGADGCTRSFLPMDASRKRPR